MDLRHRIALVTGAAHRVGRAIALALARRGASVVLHFGSSRAAAEATASEIAELGVEAWPLQADLAEPAAIAELFAAVRAQVGRLDVLVNSAASFERRPLTEISAADWDRVHAVNLRAPFLCIREAAPLLRESPRPHGEKALIVNIVDLSGMHPWVGYAHHGTAKAGLVHLTKVAACELGPEIRVNAVAPGAVLPHPGRPSDDPEFFAIGPRLPVGRVGEPADIGAAVVFLAENEFTSGVVLPIDGGESLLGGRRR